MERPPGPIRELRPHATWDLIKEGAKLMLPFLAGFGIKEWAHTHATALMWMAAIVVAASIAFCDRLFPRKAHPMSRAVQPLADARENEPRKENAQRTPNGLRRCASVLSGSLFSLLVEIGETLDAPIPRTEDMFDPAPPDPRITRLVSDQGIDKRMNEVFVYAQDLGLLSGMSAEVPQNAPEVRRKITDLWYLVGAIKH